MGKQSKLEHRVYMRLYRKYRGKNFPKEEFDKEIALEKQREQAKLREAIATEKRQKILGIQQQPKSTKPKEKNPFDLPFYEQEKPEKKEEIVYQKVDPSGYSFLKDLFSGEAEKTALNRERRISRIVHEQSGASYRDIMKGLGESEQSVKTRIYRRSIDPFLRERSRFKQKARAMLDESLTRDDLRILSGIRSPEDLARARKWLRKRAREDELD